MFAKVVSEMDSFQYNKELFIEHHKIIRENHFADSFFHLPYLIEILRIISLQQQLWRIFRAHFALAARFVSGFRLCSLVHS